MLPKRSTLNRYIFLRAVLPICVLLLVIFIKIIYDQKLLIDEVENGGIYRHALSSLAQIDRQTEAELDPSAILELLSYSGKSEFNFTEYWVTLVSLDGQVIVTNAPYFSSGQKVADYPEVIAAKSFRLSIIPEKISLADGNAIEVKNIGIQTQHRKTNFIIHLSYPDVRASDQFWLGLWSFSLYYLLLILGISGGVFWFNGKLSAALFKIREVIKDYSASHYLSGFSSNSFIAVEISRLENSVRRLGFRLQQRDGILAGLSQEQKTFLSNMDEGIAILSHELKIIHINTAFRTLFGMDSSESQFGKGLEEGVRVHDLNEFAALLREKNQDIQKNLTIAGTPPRVFSIKGKVIKKEASPHNQYLLLVKDISQVSLLEQQRKEFVANVSHELKTPLTAIKGYLEIIEDAEPIKTNPDLEKFLSRAMEQSGRLEVIVSSMSELSRLENFEENASQHFVLENIKNPIDEALSDMEVFTHKKSLKITPNYTEVPPFPMHPTLVHQAIYNLLDNAIKYSDSGGEIIITISTEANYCVIKIADYGPGIPKKHLFRIFERFYRVDEGRGRDGGGSGLGLAIVKHVALAHNGSVDVESQLGKGTTFTLKLPLSHS